MDSPLLQVQDLTVVYGRRVGNQVVAVDGLDVQVFPGEILGIAGESGSGKSTLALALLRLVKAPGRIVAGRIWFEGRDLLTLPQEELRRVRWRRISLVFQSAMNSLNPVLSIWEQFADMFQAHGIPRPEARQRAVQLLETVHVDPQRLFSYPHELSGGMRQRTVIAMALALEPSLVILDEPTTALDVVVERGIVAEIRRLRRELGFAALFITHDLALLATVADRIAIMYAGQIVEVGTAQEIIQSPIHPYTQALVRSIPKLRAEKGTLTPIAGSPPDLRRPPSGCRFHPRCPIAISLCSDSVPPFTEVSPGRPVRCHRARETREVGP